MRWPDILSAKDRGRCREILVDLVEENMARLTVQREVHEENTENLAERTAKRHGLDRSYDGELMRRYELRYKTALDRTIATYDGVRRKDSRGEEERGTPERRVPILDAGSRGQTLGTGMRTGTACRTADASDSGGCEPDDDTKWARNIDPADVWACAGYLPERVKCEGGERRAEGGGGNGEGEAAGVVPADRVGGGPAGAVQPQEGGRMDGSAGAVWPREGERLHSPAVASHSQDLVDGAFDNDVTNEPISGEEAAGGARAIGFGRYGGFGGCGGT